MNPTKLIEVIIWCNEPQSGHFSGYLTGCDIGILVLRCSLSDEGYWLLFDGNFLKVEGEQFYFADRQRRFGALECDKVTMPAESVCRLLNWALGKDFDYETFSTRFVNVIAEGRRIQVNDLDLLYFDSKNDEA